MTHCKRVIYSGRVQGVGFRMTACHLAQKQGVAGSVRNLADGSVELVAQAEVDLLERFLASVRSAMAGYIRHEEVREEPAGQRAGFEIL